MSIRSAGCAATAVVVLALVGCGGGGGGETAAKTGGGAGRTTGATGTPAGGKGNPAVQSVASPRPLPGDPCALVTESEAAQAVGGPVQHIMTSTGGPNKCTYFGAGGQQGQLTVDTAPFDCKLLYLALKENLFGDGQQRIDDIGDGGLLVKDEGEVQIAVAGGCFTIDARGAEPLADATMLSVARTAVSRVSR